MKVTQTTIPTVHGVPAQSPRRARPEPVEGVESYHTPTGPHVPALLLQPKDPIALLLVGHGAGTPMRAPLMHQMAKALAHQGIATFRYDYPYSHQLEAGYHEHLIDPLEVLLATPAPPPTPPRNLCPTSPYSSAGRSMSSQVMSLSSPRSHAPTSTALSATSTPTAGASSCPTPSPTSPTSPPHALHPSHPRPRILRPGRTPTRPQPATPTRRHPGVPSRDPAAPNHQTAPKSPLAPSPAKRTHPPRHPPCHPRRRPLPSNLPDTSNRTQQHAITEAATTTATWIRQQLKRPRSPTGLPSSWGISRPDRWPLGIL